MTEKEKPREKRCPICQQYQPYKQFKKWGLTEICRECWEDMRLLKSIPET